MYNVPPLKKSPQGILDDEIRQLKSRIEEFDYREKELMKHIDDIKEHFHRRLEVLENDISGLDSIVASKLEKPKKKRWWHRSKK